MNRTLASTYPTPVIGVLLSRFPNVNLQKIEGYYTGTAGYFFQLHDAVTTPTGLTPLRSLYLGATAPNGFLWQYLANELSFTKLTNGLYAAISSTEATFTAPAAGDKFDAVFTGEEWEFPCPQALSTAGDLTTTRKTLQVWSDANGPKSLRTLDVTNGGAATTAYILVFSKDSPSDGDVAQASIPIAAGETKRIEFGPNGGHVPFNVSAANAVTDGCTIAASTTAWSLTAPAGNDVTILASYRAQP